MEGIGKKSDASCDVFLERIGVREGREYKKFLEDLGRDPGRSEAFFEELEDAGEFDSDEEFEEADEGDADDEAMIVESEDDGSTMRIVESMIAAPKSVDREAGIIYGVKLLGMASRNGRHYTPEALREGVVRYENAPVNLDHSDSVDDPREVMECIGAIRNASLRSDGIYGDFHYLKSHLHGPTIAERAERFPQSFGMSHAAEVCGHREKGVYVVESIKQVFSVDVVSRPATTAGMFESEQGDGDESLSEKLLESAIADYKAAGKSPLDALIDWHAAGNVSP